MAAWLQGGVREWTPIQAGPVNRRRTGRHDRGTVGARRRSRAAGAGGDGEKGAGMTMADGRVARLLVNTGARRGAAVDLQTGEALEIVDVQGRQTAVLVAFHAANLDESLSPAMTRGRLNSIMIQLNDRLWSNHGRAMFEVEADTVGRHDLLLPAYDIEYYDHVHSAAGHDNDRANLALALRPWGVGYSEVPEPLTLFGNVGIRQRGELEIRRPLSEAGDVIRLRALMPVVVAVSASPHDYNLQNDYSPTEILLRVLATAEASAG
jgi:uncharacterized protein YcgI (DUF1989 family)